MQDMHTAPAAHRDNLLGICHALGETFGINPLYLRLVLLVGVMVNPVVTAIAYAVGGVAVLAGMLATRSTNRQPSRKVIA